MTKKKYRQQSDTTPLSESSAYSVPVSHSDDEGNVVIDTTTDAPIYEPIPEVVELESSSLSPSSSLSVQDPGPGPIAESSPESSDLVPAPVPELALERVLESVPVPELALERVLEPAPVIASEPIAPSQDAAPGVSEPL